MLKVLPGGSRQINQGTIGPIPTVGRGGVPSGQQHLLSSALVFTEGQPRGASALTSLLGWGTGALWGVVSRLIYYLHFRRPASLGLASLPSRSAGAVVLFCHTWSGSALSPAALLGAGEQCPPPGN